jgi:hypothetical protein
MDQFQFFFRDHPAGPVRGTWQEAAQDAVAAGLADWVHENPHRAINWAIAGQASIARITAQPRIARCTSTHDLSDGTERRASRSGKLWVIGAPSLPALMRAR